jgi:hypothetical protein
VVLQPFFNLTRGGGHFLFALLSDFQGVIPFKRPVIPKMTSRSCNKHSKVHHLCNPPPVAAALTIPHQPMCDLLFSLYSGMIEKGDFSKKTSVF